MGEGRGEDRAGRKARPAWKRKFHLEYCWATDANGTISTHVGNKGDHKDLYEYILNQTGYICFYVHLANPSHSLQKKCETTRTTEQSCR